jgi:hypothetical protein
VLSHIFVLLLWRYNIFIFFLIIKLINQLEILSFGIGHLAYSICIIIGYYGYFFFLIQEKNKQTIRFGPDIVLRGRSHRANFAKKSIPVDLRGKTNKINSLHSITPRSNSDSALCAESVSAQNVKSGLIQSTKVVSVLCEKSDMQNRSEDVNGDELIDSLTEIRQLFPHYQKGKRFIYKKLIFISATDILVLLIKNFYI